MIEIEIKSTGTAIRYYIVGTSIVHRDDGPAIIYNNGTKKWYQYGKLHREDGPAAEYYDGGKYWFFV